MSEQQDTGTTTDAPDGLDDLVGDWLDPHQAADALGVPVNRVHRLVSEHQLAATTVGTKGASGPGRGLRVPALFIEGREVVKGLPGLLTVLHDNGFDDREAIRWIFTADESLPGRPIDALRENRGREAKRRAQAMA